MHKCNYKCKTVHGKSFGYEPKSWATMSPKNTEILMIKKINK